ncbi:MAG: lytic murein transglycosylase [Alphaproteobacteria bacterium]
MKTCFINALLILASIALISGSGPAQAQNASFDDWLSTLRAEAIGRGISESTLDIAFAGLEPIDRVLELDKSQPEFTQTFWTYLNRAISDARIERGRALLKEHAALLAEVEKRYGVQPRFLVAFWGLETNFGDYTGGFPVIGALATLAHDPRRSDFFRNELMHALSILEAGDITVDRMSGSWAGAMGQPQFMPSTFTGYARDGDGDGKRDLWNSLPDVFHSAANYLSQVGWSGDETWGREVLLPADFDLDLVGLETRKQIGDWSTLGVTRANGNALPVADIEGSIVLPAGRNGPAFLVYGNYRAILVWNRSTLYALAVGILSDRLINLGRLVASQPENDRPLSRTEILAMQHNLNKLGFSSGEPDGMVGPMTRNAIRDYQRKAGLPADAYPTDELLRRIDAEAAAQ